MIEGLARALSSGASMVVDAISGVVTGAISAAKSALGIASPSKVFEAIGEFTVQGFSGAVDDGAADANAAMAGMVEPPVTAFEMQPSRVEGRGRASGGGASITIDKLEINGIEKAEDIAPNLAALLTRILEGDALALAGGEA